MAAITNSGKSWGLSGLSKEIITTILISPSRFISPKYRIYLGCVGAEPGLGGVQISDPVSTWSLMGLMYGDVTALALRGQFLFAGITNGSNGNLLGTDYVTGSTEFFNFSHGLPVNVPVRSITTMDTSVWCGTDKGVYRSLDAGRNWTLGGLDSLKVTTLLVSGNVLYAGTQTDGIYRYSNGASISPRRLISPKSIEAFWNYDVLGRTMKSGLGRNIFIPISIFRKSQRME